MPTGRQALGSHGEALAARWYEARGYDVVARNWRIRDAELDLVMRRGGLLVFCEVKTRRDDRFGTAAEAVTPAKQRRVRRAAVAYLGASSERPKQLRFDVACVVGRQVDVIESAF
ncbi:MAG: YraN family protein [Acidimicrobiales bacterium]